MTRIVFTVTSDPEYDQRMQRICSALANEGYDVTLIGRKPKPTSSLTKRSFHQKRLSCWFQKGKWFYAEFNIRLFFYLLFKRTDIICGIDLDTILPTYWIARLRGKTFVYDAHEYFTESANLIHRKKEQRIWKRIEQRVLPNVKHAYTVNQSIADLFKKEYGVEFAVIRNVPYYEEKGANPSEKVLVYQGAMRGERGLPELVSAMQQIDARLIMAGGGALLPELEELAKQKGVTDKITFTGQLNPDDLRNITRSAYIGISPLEPVGFNHLYSLSNKFLEYIQMEVPQVAMNFAEYRNINDKFGVAVLMDDVKSDDFVNAINTLLNDEQLCLRLKKGTQEAKKELNWESEKTTLVQFYHNIVAN